MEAPVIIALLPIPRQAPARWLIAAAVARTIVSMAEGDVLHIVDQVESGDQAVLDDLFTHLYGELRTIAERLVREGRGSLQPTLLVHEVYLKLAGSANLSYKGKTHVRAIAACAMRQVIVDDARRRNRAKRGGNWERVSLQGLDGDGDALVDVPLIQINDALTELAALDDRAARVVILRFFGAPTDDEIGSQLGVTGRTVRNDWRMARAWLRARLERSLAP